MAGWNTTFLFRRPIFRTNMLVSGRVLFGYPKILDMLKTTSPPLCRASNMFKSSGIESPTSFLVKMSRQMLKKKHVSNHHLASILWQWQAIEAELTYWAMLTEHWLEMSTKFKLGIFIFMIVFVRACSSWFTMYVDQVTYMILIHHCIRSDWWIRHHENQPDLDCSLCWLYHLGY